MKYVVLALMTVSVLAGIAGSASALDAKTFYEQQDRAQHKGADHVHEQEGPHQLRIFVLTSQSGL
jgi:hypothetical protein